MSKREYIYAICEEFVESPFGVSTSLDMTITREEIIRCRDCRHKDDWLDEGGQCGVDPNGFCAWGER